jgi:hypothetical protein
MAELCEQNRLRGTSVAEEGSLAPPPSTRKEMIRSQCSLKYSVQSQPRKLLLLNLRKSTEKPF